MGWTEKYTPSPFDNQPIPGLLFLNGDVLARDFNLEWTKGQKFPVIVFPSGFEAEIWESQIPEKPIVHIFGELDLPLSGTQESGFAQIIYITEQLGYVVQKVEENQLEVWGLDEEEHVLITYDNDQRMLINIEQVEPKPAEQQPREPLLPDDIRAKLPPLYSQEQLGLLALAIVKFYVGDWTWYASEGSPVDEDGYYDTDKEKVDFLLFGLVAGFEVELGYFSLSELEALEVPMTLPDGRKATITVERDHHFQPTTVRQLKAQHEQAFGE